MEWEVGYRPGVLHVLKFLLSLSFTSTAKPGIQVLGTKADPQIWGA